MLKIIFLTFSFIVTSLYTQNSLTFDVFDKTSNKTLSSSILLRSLGDNNSISQKSSLGHFVIDHLDSNKNYNLSIYSFGYNIYNYDNISIKGSKYLGKIFLDKKINKIKDVLIKTKNEDNIKDLDKKVYLPHQLLNSQNANATELLNNLPSINTNDNTLSFRGDENISVMINSKNTTIDLNNLNNIPASSIEKIEVLSNPSSKYSSDGSSGIINIILKKNQGSLNSGFIGFGIDNSLKTNFQSGFYWNINKFSFITSYEYKYNDNFKTLYSYKELLDSNYYQLTTKNITSIEPNHNGRLSIDYLLDNKNSINFNFNTSIFFNNSFENNSYFDKYQSDRYKEKYNFNDNINNNGLYYDFGLNYSFYNNDLSNLNIQLNYNSNNNDISNYQTFFNELIDFDTNNTIDKYKIDKDQRRSTALFQIDHSMNLNKKNILESGIKVMLRDFRFTNYYYNNNSGNFNIDQTKSNNFNYEELTNALYSNWVHTSKKFTTNFGLRLEQTNTISKSYDTIIIYNFNYFNFFPSIFISYKLNEKNKLNFSYSYRINRPSIGFLNPINENSERSFIRLGNPKLKPEYIHKTEVGVESKITNNFSNSTSLYYSNFKDAITRFLYINDDKSSTLIIDNIGVSNIIGLESIFDYRVNNAIKININTNFIRKYIEYTNNDKKYNFQYNDIMFKINSNIKISKSIDFQLFYFYNSTKETPQGIIDFTDNLGFTLRKKMFNNKLLLTFGLNDILDNTKFDIRLKDNNFISTAIRKSKTKIFLFSLKYNFGLDKKIDYKIKISKEKEME